MDDTKQKTILIVEDEPLVSMIITKQLKEGGYKTISSLTGEAAIDIINANKEPIDLILMDIDLGKGIDGTQAAQEILKTNDIPVLFHSSHTEPEIVNKTEKITSYGYVVKSSSPTVLFASIKMAFKLFQEKQEHRKAENMLHASEFVVRKKLNAIMAPEGDLNLLTLSDIIDIDRYRTMMEEFNRITGIASAIIDLEGKVIVGVGWQDICTKFHRCHPETLKNCLESDTVLTKGINPGEFRIYRCKNNLVDMATPIILNDKHIGNFFIGQYLYSDDLVDKNVFLLQAKSYGFDEKEYLAALDKVPKFPKKIAEAIMTFYFNFTQLILTLSFNAIKLSRTVKEQKDIEAKLWESQSRFLAISENTILGINIMDTNYRILSVNSACSKMFNKPVSEMIGKQCFREFEKHQDICPFCPGKLAMVSRKTHETITTGIRDDGSKFFVNIRAVPFFDKEGILLGFVEIADDITEAKNAEEKIQTLLNEKELLLREIHHRIKNNMNSIAALLELQAYRTDEEKVSYALMMAKNRILSMSILYDKLFRSDNFKEVPIKAYLENLIDEILISMKTSVDITTEKHIEDFIITPRLSFPVGIIVNEIFTNAIKHAFKGRKRGLIRIEASVKDKIVSICLEDDGVGLPENINFEHSNGFGFYLINVLIKQIEGTISVAKKSNGTRFTLSFPV